MHSSGSTAIKAIVGIGVVTFLLLFFVAFTLQRAIEPSEAERVSDFDPRSPFDGARAYADLKEFVAIGSRVPGTAGAKAARVFIREKLEAAGLSVREWPFEANTPLGKRPMANVVGTIKGTAPGIIILSNHYDTKYLPDIEFVGANDGGSTTAWMLEMARTIGPDREGRSIWLCFFDGEEAFEEWTDTDSLYGSRHMVEALSESGQLRDVEAVLNVDMIGDCYLGIFRDAGAPEWMSRIIWNKAGELGYGIHFLSVSLPMEDDHIPFRKAGVDAVNLIDFRYGGTMFDHNKNWHTANDTVERVCPESLQAVGDVVYHILSVFDGYLDRNG